MLIAILTIIVFAACVAVIWIDWEEATDLNLRLGGCMADVKLGDKFRATIAPTNDLGLPAAVTGVEYGIVGVSYTIEQMGDEAIYTAVALGSGNKVQVAATAKSGSGLLDEVDLPDVTVDPEEATKLNLKVEPVAG